MPSVWVAPSFASQDMRSFGILHPMFDFGYGESAAVPAHVSVPNRIGLAFAGLPFLVKGPAGLVFEPRP